MSGMKVALLALKTIWVVSIVTIANASPATKKTTEGIIVYPTEGPARAVRLAVVSDKIIRVTASPTTTFSGAPSLMVLPYKTPVNWQASEKDGVAVLQTALIKANISLQNGAVSFTDKSGHPLLSEVKEGGRAFQPEQVEGQQLYQVAQYFESPANEALYGLGQHQEGLMNYKGETVTLLQYNSDIAIPYMISSRNYGILWDNYSITRASDCRPYESLASLKLYNKDGQAGALTAVYENKNQPSQSVTREEKTIHYPFLDNMKDVPAGYKMGSGNITWEGFIESDFTGLHKLHVYNGGYVKLWIDGKLMADVWRQSWNAANTRIQLPMEKGRKYAFKLEWQPDGGESYCEATWMSPIPEKDKDKYGFSSEAGRQIDYYFVAGNNLDEVISGYRKLTGKANILPQWAYGFWQSRERYKTQDEILNTIAEFRKRKIGIDNIVLDWSYWKQDQWGSHEFDSTRFPNPDDMIKQLHEKYHAHFMISVWPKFYPGTRNYDEMNAKGYLYKKNIELGRRDWIAAGYHNTFYDAYNADARKLFWKQMNEKLYTKGIDAWWMDATEPDIHSNLNVTDRKEIMTPNAMGSSTEYFNAFALQNAKGIYEGQRSVDPNKRVFILTRSAYGGLQRYSAAVWSGDIGTKWLDMKNQIAAGINYGLSGLPNWTQDVGGFSVEKKFENATGEVLEEWREQNARWYQFGMFNPLFRVHGQYPFREIFNIAPEDHPAYQSMLYYNKLRYRLIPYIYSLGGMTYHRDYTIMRGLPMDFPNDDAVKNIGDEYMFGPAFLVNPVYTYKATSRSVYLPAGKGWYDTYTGKFETGGKKIEAAAPYERMPLFVKAGSIIPTGPAIEYVSQKPADTLTVFVYTGDDGRFDLYEDQGLNYDYEKGKYSIIPFSWNEASHTFSVGARTGTFEGLIKQRIVRVIPVAASTPKALDPDQETGYIIRYNGIAASIKLK